MGDPKNPRRAWKKPKRPFNYDLKMEELKTLGTFGLKTKRELWKAHTQLSRLRHQARSLLALSKEVRKKEEPILMNSLVRRGLVGENSTLDDVLNLQVPDLLSRRLETVVHKKLGFKTPYQARQAVVHGHIMIGDRKVNVPSYIVKVNEEKEIHLTPESSLKDVLAKAQKEIAEMQTKQPTDESKEVKPQEMPTKQPTDESKEVKPEEMPTKQPTDESKEVKPEAENASQQVENSSTKPLQD